MLSADIIEKNKVIGEYYGLRERGFSSTNFPRYYDPTKELISVDYSPNELSFDDDIRWQFAVIKKIEGQGYIVTISTKEVCIEDDNEFVISYPIYKEKEETIFSLLYDFITREKDTKLVSFGL